MIRTVPTDPTFDALVNEARAVDVTGWDFSWFEGRATEDRPPWGYQRLVADRLHAATHVVDVQTGGGEVVAGALRMSGASPHTVTATESWAPNLGLARTALAPWNGRIIECPNDEVPLPDASADLVVSRHPVTTAWEEIARVLSPNGTYLSQEVGNGSVRELTEAMVGPFDASGREPEVARSRAEGAGLEVIRLETASLPMTFHDIGAVIVSCGK